MNTKKLICVVDDDDAIRESLRALLEAAGYAVEDYTSARRFLESHTALNCNCLIVDVRMPEMNGFELQEELVRRRRTSAVIVITGHADVALAVRAMKAGALDFIEKPFQDEFLLLSVERALELGRRARNEAEEARAAREILALLTPRELDVLKKLVAGRPNKIAAHELGISPRTIEIHRARIMDKMNVHSLSEVVRIAIAAERAA
jgi:two-component system, LuxR family, response regulator FixJ